MLTNTSDFLLPDPFLDQIRTYVLATGKFNIADVKAKYRVGFRRAIFIRDKLVTEGILDPIETDGQNWLSGSLVLVQKEDELQMALEKMVGIVGSAGLHDFEKLVEIMGNDRMYVMRLVIIAGVKSLLSLLGGK